MKLTFPRKVETLDLAEYMPEMAGQTLDVWVNPPNGQRLELYTALRNAAETPGDETAYQVYARLAELLSQGAEDRRISAEELRELAEASTVTDPRFWSWLVIRVIEMIETHRGAIKKN